MRSPWSAESFGRAPSFADALATRRNSLRAMRSRGTVSTPGASLGRNRSRAKRGRRWFSLLSPSTRRRRASVRSCSRRPTRDAPPRDRPRRAWRARFRCSSSSRGRAQAPHVAEPGGGRRSRRAPPGQVEERSTSAGNSRVARRHPVLVILRILAESCPGHCARSTVPLDFDHLAEPKCTWDAGERARAALRRPGRFVPIIPSSTSPRCRAPTPRGPCAAAQHHAIPLRPGGVKRSSRAARDRGRRCRSQ